MEDYIVQIPITGFVGTCIYARNEKEAIEKGLALKYQLTDIEEWGIKDVLVKDGIFQGMQNSIIVEAC